MIKSSPEAGSGLPAVWHDAFQHGRVHRFDLFGGPRSHQQWPENDRRLCTPTSSSQLCCSVCIVAEAARDSATDLLPHLTWLACRIWHRRFVANTMLLIRQSTSGAWQFCRAQNTANMTTNEGKPTIYINKDLMMDEMELYYTFKMTAVNLRVNQLELEHIQNAIGNK